MLEHVREVAEKNGIEVKVDAGYVAWRSRKSENWVKAHSAGLSDSMVKRLYLSHGEDTEDNYAVGLHELGHLLSQNQSLRVMGNIELFAMMWDLGLVDIYSDEVDAWEWAKANSKFGWTEAMEKMKIESLLSYEKGLFGK